MNDSILSVSNKVNEDMESKLDTFKSDHDSLKESFDSLKDTFFSGKEPFPFFKDTDFNDLDTLVDTGVYVCIPNKNYQNSPGGNYNTGAYVLVFTVESIVFQLWLGSKHHLYSRVKVNNSWTSWSLYFSQNNKPSKSDVGLSNVQNYPIADKTTAEKLSSNKHYMTPESTKYALQANTLSKSDVTEMINNVTVKEEDIIAMGFKKIVNLTAAQYNALSNTQKNDPNTVYLTDI